MPNIAQFEAAEREKHGGHIPTDFSGADPAIGVSEPTGNTASNYLERTGNHYVADKLNMSHYYKVDPLLETKVAEVDRYFQNSLKEFGMRDSTMSIDALLEQATGVLGASLEEFVRNGGSKKVIEHLFSHISLQNKKSSESYMEEAMENQVQEKVQQFENRVLNTLIRSLKELGHQDVSKSQVPRQHQPRHIWYAIGRREAERPMRLANPKRKTALNFV